MVIGFDGSRAFTANKTGTENYSYQLLKALAKIDKVNQCIVYLRLGMQGDALQGWPKNFQFSILNFQFLWTQAGLAIQTFKDNLDVLFVPAHTLPVIRKPGLKTVVTVHDLGSEYLPSTHQVKQRLYLGLMQRFQLKTATGIIAVSKATKDDLVKKLGIDPDKVRVVYEGWDRKKFQVPRPRSAKRGGPSSKFQINQTIKKYDLRYHSYFLFVGTVQPRKNLERLIKAFSVISSSVIPAKAGIYTNNYLYGSRIKSGMTRQERENDNLKLVIAGSKGWLSDEIYQLPKKLGIEDRVKFLGYVPDVDLPALYSGAIALTFPSLFEGFGLPILEAQACGCPVLTSNLSSMPEIAGKGAVYVENPYDVDDIVKGMVKVQSSEFRVQSIRAGLENVKRFSWEKAARETLKVLESL